MLQSVLITNESTTCGSIRRDRSQHARPVPVTGSAIVKEGGIEGCAVDLRDVNSCSNRHPSWVVHAGWRGERRRHNGILGTTAGEGVGLKELPDRESVREVIGAGFEPYEEDDGAP